MPISIEKMMEGSKPKEVEMDDVFRELPKSNTTEKIKKSLAGYCFHNNCGMCEFFMADIVSCEGVCPQWKSYVKKVKRAFNKSKDCVTWYDLTKIKITSPRQVQMQLSGLK